MFSSDIRYEVTASKSTVRAILPRKSNFDSNVVLEIFSAPFKYILFSSFPSKDSSSKSLKFPPSLMVCRRVDLELFRFFSGGIILAIAATSLYNAKILT